MTVGATVSFPTLSRTFVFELAHTHTSVNMTLICTSVEPRGSVQAKLSLVQTPLEVWNRGTTPFPPENKQLKMKQKKKSN